MMETEDPTANAPLPGTPPDDGHTAIRVDFFGIEDDDRHVLPDQVSWVSLKRFREGDRKKFQNRVNKDVKFAKGSGDMSMRLAPGDERHELLSIAITGWDIHKAGKPYLFSVNALQDFLDQAPTTVIDNIEKRVREINPWIGSELTSDDIRSEIDRLEELLVEKIKEEEGN